MKVAAIVLNHDSATYLPACLNSLTDLALGETTLEIIVVDNASVDNSLEILKKDFSQVTLFALEKNLGFSEGYNSAIRYCLSRNIPYIWLIDPQVTVDKHSLSALLEAAQNFKSGGIFGSKIYLKKPVESESKSPTIWYAGGNMDWNSLTVNYRGVNSLEEGQYQDDLETDFIPGESMFIRSRVFSSSGLFDSQYFLYYDVHDLCQRVKAAGWQLMFIPDSILWINPKPQEPVIPSIKDYYLTRNQLLFGLRYGPPITKIRLLKHAIELYFQGKPWEKRAVIDFYSKNFGPGSFQP